MDEEKTLTYAVIAASIIAIVLLGYFTFRGESEVELVELYFQDPDTLPQVMVIGREYDIAFEVVSHKKSEEEFTYVIEAEGKVIKEGKFFLSPSEAKRVSASFAANDLITNLTSHKVNEWTSTGSSDDPQLFLQNYIAPMEFGRRPLPQELILYVTSQGVSTAKNVYKYTELKENELIIGENNITVDITGSDIKIFHANGMKIYDYVTQRLKVEVVNSAGDEWVISSIYKVTPRNYGTLAESYIE